MANVLTKDFICAYCKEPMKSGEAFKWHEGYRSAVGPKVGGSYTLAKIPTFKPRHTFDCLGLKVAREARANAISAIEDGCAMAAKMGETAEYIADFRAKLMTVVDRDYPEAE